MTKATPFRNPSGEVKWRVQFRIDGKGKQETFEAEREASRFASAVDRVGGKVAREQLASRRNRVSNTPTLAEWMDKYLDPASGILTGIQPGTRNGYRSIAKNVIIPRLGGIPIDEITRDDVGAWVVWVESQPSGTRKGQPVAAKTVRNYHALLSNVFEAARDRRLITENPAHRTRVSEGVSREGVFLSVDEFTRILEQIPPYHRPLVMFLAGTGARWSEATALNGGDVERGATPVLVSLNKAWKKPGEAGGGHVIGVTKTKAGRRTLSLHPDLVDVLPQRPSNELLFQGATGVGRVWYGPFRDKVWVPAVERADIGKRPNLHDLRHTHASWLIAKGAPLPFIQRRLGHEKITTTIDLYGHLLPEAQTVVADIMQDLFSSIPREITHPSARDQITA